jgi:hypothetical protein
MALSASSDRRTPASCIWSRSASLPADPVGFTEHVAFELISIAALSQSLVGIRYW